MSGEGAIGAVIETGVKVAVDTVASAGKIAAPAVVNTAGETAGLAANVGASATEAVAPVARGAIESTAAIVGDSENIGQEIGNTASELARATREGTEIAGIREDLDALILQREIDGLNQGANNSRDFDRPDYGRRISLRKTAGAFGDVLTGDPPEADSGITEEHPEKAKPKTIASAEETTKVAVAAGETVAPAVAKTAEGTAGAAATVGASATEAVAPIARGAIQAAVNLA